MKITSTLEAWKEAQKHVHNYEKDHEASKNAGYSIYRGDEGHISDLETRLEINLNSGESFNIWIEEEAEQPETVEAPEGKYISVELVTDTYNGGGRTTTIDEATICVNSDLKISKIGAFIACVERMLKRAKKSTKNGSLATLTIYTKDGKISDMWQAQNDDINDEGVYFSPSETNENPAHDFIITSITAAGIMRELSI